MSVRSSVRSIGDTANASRAEDGGVPARMGSVPRRCEDDDHYDAADPHTLAQKHRRAETASPVATRPRGLAVDASFDFRRGGTDGATAVAVGERGGASTDARGGRAASYCLRRSKR
eukprot:CAMPEP_0119485648 /NCGR_PEP_ID=MMETSP1344-20130328/12291_1 /TAXON_ID=236787 /ORGANISM="Florenciella parvula, Strain CCMP2471" /LENGTH=115 /DNA_ID=CAMNT_0007520337 /DNA_START=252 /DNA_END=596 /DNA_ORIENTATION=+